jgi:hypothetical protein
MTLNPFTLRREAEVLRQRVVHLEFAIKEALADFG